MALASDELEKSKSTPRTRKQGAEQPAVKAEGPNLRERAAAILRAVRRFFGATVFSNLTRRIVFLNLAAITVLVAGIFYLSLNQWRAGLIDARVQSLRVQGEIISAAVAASATVDSDVIQVNPDRLIDLLPGSANAAVNFFDPSLEFPISPERVAPLLGELVTPTKTRARIYDKDGFLILDSANLYTPGEVLQPLTPPEQKEVFFLVEWWNRMLSWVPGAQFSLYQEYDASEGKRYPEVNVALTGAPADIVRVDAEGRLVVSVAVPVQRARAIVGVLLLSTSPGDIEAIVATERAAILRIALVAAVITSIFSFLLAGTIAGPMRRLSAAAERVQVSMNNRAEIPDYTERSDEIGHLSGALRAMTNALYARMEAIERFAADVAHELKNPLTSLRSAVETLPLVTKKEDRDRLTGIIQHDVRRLDRLISDISNASRLDAELVREGADSIDIGEILEALVSMHSDLAAARDITVTLDNRSGKLKPLTTGHDSRLAQVFTNLIDNAISFSPDSGTVTISLLTDADTITVRVEDEGQGIRGDTHRIFERFYTDRPENEQFGDHSGLGLSISKQIVEAHNGTITGRNRKEAAGAMFEVVLPRHRK